MKGNSFDQEFLSCERYVVTREEQAGAIFGNKNRTELIGSKKKQVFIRFLLFLRGFGFLLLFLNEASNRKNLTINVFQNKVAFSDHANKLLQRKIFDITAADKKNNYGNQSLNSPLLIFLRFKVLSAVFQSYYRVRPPSLHTVYKLCNFWVYYTIYSYWLFKLSLSGVLIVDDFSSLRVALVLAAKDAGLRVGIVKMSDELDRPCPFFGYDILFCWNQEQSYHEEGMWKITSHLPRPFHPIRHIILDNNRKLIVGIAVNAFFNKNGLLNLLFWLDSEEWVKKSIIRFHPRSALKDVLSEMEDIDFEISAKDPEIFFKNIDMLICGRTSLIKDALLAGIPVVFEASLDVERKEEYGYITRGVVYDMTGKKWDKDYFKNINHFYQSETWKKKQEQWITQDSRAVSIDDAVAYLRGLDIVRDK